MDSPLDWPSADCRWTEHGHELTVPLAGDLIPTGAAVPARLRHEIDAELEERLEDFHGLHHVLEVAGPPRLVLRAPHLFQVPAVELRRAVDAAFATAASRHAARTDEETRVAEPWLAALRAG